ncbi:hypothetical protein R50073_39230 [Maricurvus nonylphenolicus]
MDLAAAIPLFAMVITQIIFMMVICIIPIKTTMMNMSSKSLPRILMDAYRCIPVATMYMVQVVVMKPSRMGIILITLLMADCIMYTMVIATIMAR